MPHYRLNLCNATDRYEDAEGADYPDVPAAKRAAIAGIRAVLSADALDGQIDLGGYLDIVDDAGRIVERVGFRDAIKVLQS